MIPPPGYVAYGAPGAFSPFRNIRGITKALVILQICMAVATGLVLLFQLLATGKANDYLDGVASRSEFEDALGPFILVSLLSGLVGIAALVLLIIWSYRIAGNLQKIGREPLTWKPGLTIVVWLLGGCTLNIINLLMLSEHWKASDPSLPPHTGAWRDRPVSPLIKVWFALGIGQIVLGAASGLRSFGGVGFGNDTNDVAESLADRSAFVLLSGGLGVAATVVLVLIIRQLSARHVEMTREG